MINILIPMGGKGQRFKNAGYKLTKPLIDVKGKPMIEVVINNIKLENCRFIFIVSKNDIEEFNIDLKLKNLCDNCIIIEEDPSERIGAAKACLLAKELINNKNQLIIANSDQLLNWNQDLFINKMNELDCDGSIVTFIEKEGNPKWSFAKVENGLVTEVAEKKVISNIATVGVYYFKHGLDFILALETMIEKNIKVNNEFYVCPVFNELVNNKKIVEYRIDEFNGLGTPEDLERFLSK
jgi:dTDP-glucose pyrophosphorylase